MLVVQTPLRMSFVGGGTDLPSFYSKFGGAVISTTINKFVYITLGRSFEQKARVVYSKLEEQDSLLQIEHKLVRSIARKVSFDEFVEIHSIGDVPAQGTGLGSSSAFTVGLIHAMYAAKGQKVSSELLAELACDVEINMNGAPIGKQDQYSASFGGLNTIRFERNGEVKVQKVPISDDQISRLFSHILVFFTGKTRSANAILGDQDKLNETAQNQKALNDMLSLVSQFESALVKDQYDELGAILDENWRLKRSLVSTISYPELDKAYQFALKNGAYGGKLLGAGGGGFLMFLAPPEKHPSLIEKFSAYKLQDWNYFPHGSRVVFDGDQNG